MCVIYHVFNLLCFYYSFLFSDYCYANIIFQFFFSIPITTSTLARKQENFWSKNTRLNRPMSPHLTIYRYNVHFTTYMLQKKKYWLILGKRKKNSEMPIPRNLKMFEFWFPFSWTRMNFLNIKCSLCQQKYINNNQNLQLKAHSYRQKFTRKSALNAMGGGGLALLLKFFSPSPSAPVCKVLDQNPIV